MSTPASLDPGTGMTIGSRSGGDDQLVVGLDYAAVRRHGPLLAVDRDDPVAFVKRHSMVDVPAVAVDDDLLEGLLARQDRRQHDAVVIDARLGVEDRDLVGFGSGFEEFLERAARRHTVADDRPGVRAVWASQRPRRLPFERVAWTIFLCLARTGRGDGARRRRQKPAAGGIRRWRRRGPSDRAKCGASGC